MAGCVLCLQTLHSSSRAVSGGLSRETVGPKTKLFILGVSKPFPLLGLQELGRENFKCNYNLLITRSLEF